MQKTVNLLRGFVRVAVECPYPERFINRCAANRVAFWGVVRIDELRLEAVIPARCLARARSFAERLGGTLTPLRRRGALFFLERFRRRYVLVAGLLLCLAALFVSNRFIWEFTVEGNETVPAEAILEALREIGVSVGSRSDKVDIEDARNRVLLKLGDLSWLTVNVSGSRASVVVRERRKKPEIFSRHTPVNIVAAKAGLITRMEALSGSAQVFPGDTVREGQLLVSGLVDSARVGMRLINARADVTARTWTELQMVMPTGAVGKRYTGRSKTRLALVFAGRRINLYQNSSQPYAICDKMSKTSILRVPGGVTFPLALVKETFTEVEPVPYQMDESVAESLLRQELEKTLQSLVSRGEVLTETVTFHTGPGTVTAALTAECLERIDKARKIDLAETFFPPPA